MKEQIVIVYTEEKKWGIDRTRVHFKQHFLKKLSIWIFFAVLNDPKYDPK